LGQMLSTRADLLGDEVAVDLAMLRDRLTPFPAAEARAMVEKELAQPIADLFTSFDDVPVSAASIAQVHYATTSDGPPGGEVAVKILRPGIEHAFARDVDLLRWLARLVERTQPKLRRLKPVAVVETFAETVRMEMDLRLEAAAASELAANFAGDPSYRVPAVDWRRTARRVMTQQRLTGIALGDRDALRAAGHDIPSVLSKAAAIFFNQVFRDGYFHADQHPGNMFVDADGNIGAVDFGIMGRLDRKTRYYLADMLLGFIERDYRRVAEVHITAGYVPPHQSVENFAQACRSIGEPIFGRPLNEISFARVLGQLFQIAETFDMEVQPQLLLLQKNMLMAEGVSRGLDPALNIWTLTQPLIERWMRDNRGPEARLRQAASDLLHAVERLPSVLANIENSAARLADGKIRLHADNIAEFASGRGRSDLALWALTAAVAALAVALVLTW
ncbi:MAG TPA: 2-polyprenylphenol 6-hydroxylase, partial [Methylomirabilota bacterium]|nr:2-polyprenylphenol 6-hydroxylase [Methylomirabilota bacterium]